MRRANDMSFIDCATGLLPAQSLTDQATSFRSRRKKQQQDNQRDRTKRSMFVKGASMR